eukprot:CAMPEP_0176200282 /NCGR_PEP_ID=MMETSP0121_2-20121125/8979_1 /TAXON_ID=160619 /ORGANISM="Kryptoperidinium foliaceum, Strain CCMP 1326" /LENGTH=211 /DNA_ID=CAMNT_0017539141 /DNA_START=74 /DNA_END=707 /DNA_ORIENTATION=-
MALLKKSPAMKAPKSTAMKAKKRGSKIAKGRLAKALVLRGSKEKTSGGLRKEALMKNKRGRVVSKRASAVGKQRYRNIETWVDSLVEARRALRISGFVAVNGKTLQGKALYVKAKALCTSRSRAAAPLAAAAEQGGAEPSGEFGRLCCALHDGAAGHGAASGSAPVRRARLLPLPLAPPHMHSGGARISHTRASPRLLATACAHRWRRREK